MALQFLPRPKEPEIPKSLVAKHIADNNNVERYESVENVTLYTLKEYADIFKSENSVGSEELCSDETVKTFMEFLSIDEKQCDIIFAKTVRRANSQFWFDKKSGRITASNFYKVCHMRNN